MERREHTVMKAGSEASTASTVIDVLCIGRVGVDLYPLQENTSLRHVETFGKFLGGSAANVAVAAAQHGRNSALIARTGQDAFGDFVRDELERLGVQTKYIGTDPEHKTPLTFCEIHPPDNFPITFYRDPIAPDLTITAEELPLNAIRTARILWCTVTGLSKEPSRATHHAAWRARAKRTHTILDLDYRDIFWPDQATATAAVTDALEHATIAIGNQQECAVAVGETDPHRAADALLARGIKLAVVKLGPEGVLAKTATETITVPPHPVTVINGLGAGDAFGGAFCHGLLAGWTLTETLTFANVAGAIVAGKRECANAMPQSSEVHQLLQETNQATQRTQATANERGETDAETASSDNGAETA